MKRTAEGVFVLSATVHAGPRNTLQLHVTVGPDLCFHHSPLIVGLFTDVDNRGKAYFVDRGRFEPFEVPGATSTAGWDVNQAGVAVGLYRDASGKFHGFQFDGTTFGSVDFPGATATRVFGINASGDMVGAYVDSAARTHAFIAEWGPAR